ncbi:hypothetical protein OROGR_010664 [Orobanche gracilis]
MAVVASAPGKVLVTGGYLILERPNAGIVLSTNARFYAIVKPLYEEIKPESWAWEWMDVKLTSPQMARETMYKLSLKHLQLLCASSSDSRNPFVEYALQYAVAAAHATFHQTKKEELEKLLLLGLDIEILGCNGFYSYRNQGFVSQEQRQSNLGLHLNDVHKGKGMAVWVIGSCLCSVPQLILGYVQDASKLVISGWVLVSIQDCCPLGMSAGYSRVQIEARGLPLTPESLASLPPFTSITLNAEESSDRKSKPEVAKTGLGSSAAMTTAVAAALLHYLGVVSLPSEISPLQGNQLSNELDVVHIISQTAHCIAQGKVGSGFDVSSAVYGSQRYIRFSPEVLSSAQDAVEGISIEKVISNVLEANWDHERTKFSLPPMMTLVLGEPGTGGSSTPSMVGAVKKWQKSDPRSSLEIWNKLSEANSALEMHLNTLSQLAETNYDAYRIAIGKCSTLMSEKQWTEGSVEPNQTRVVKALLGARDAMLSIRCNMRKMGEAAGIPIEPESQTLLLDTTMNTEGVLLAGVPGAGGFDAVFAVTLGNSSSNVINVWSSLDVLALLVREDPRGVHVESNDPREITGAISKIRIE